MSNFKAPIVLPSLNKLQWLQGSEKDMTHDFQLMLMIQPNCPGCHMHALSLANELASTKQDFDIYCISTAFEDFEFNTEENARLLLEGKHVGVAKEQLGEEAQHVPKMPLAHDIVTLKDIASDDLKSMALESVKAAARIQLRGRVPVKVLEANLEQVGYDVLPEKIPEFFYRLEAMGTPTWALHTADGTVLGTKFGQMTKIELASWMNSVANRELL